VRDIYRHPRGERDLREIWRYTFENWGERQADIYLRKIDAAIQTLRGGSAALT
jgi:toxin ParE1/3/4